MKHRVSRGFALFAILFQFLTLDCIAPALAAEAPPDASAAEGNWRMLTTPRYTVVSQLSEKETRAWAHRFDLFIAAAMQYVRSDVRQLPHTTVVLFARGRNFGPYKPLRPDGKRDDNVAGVFSRRPSWGVIGIAGDSRDEESQRTIYHEATHWIMSTDTSAQPKWFEEGIAEALSSFEIKSGKVRWGQVLQDHVDNLAVGSRIPAQRLFNLRDDDPLFNRDDRTGMFYSTSWAMVHYLVFGLKPDTRKKLGDYLRLYRTESPDDAFTHAFGGDYAQLDQEIRAYLNGGRFGITTLPLPEVPDDAVLSTPTTAQVHEALGRLAYAVDNPALARLHADKALSADPSLVSVRELRALLAAAGDNDEAARHEAGMAARLGSRDAEMYLLIADGARSARERADAYERALMLAPRLRRGYAGLLRTLYEIDKPTATDASFLEQGRRAYPHFGGMVLGLAEVAYRNGDRARAVTLAREATAEGMETTPELVESARSTQARWAFEEAMPKLDPLMREHRYAEARQLVDDLEASSDEPQFRVNVQRVRVSVVAMERLDAAGKALSQGRRDEAKAIFVEVAATPDLPPQLLSQVQDRLRTLGAKASRP